MNDMQEVAVGQCRDGARVTEAVYQLTDTLYRAETSNEVYEAALDAIIRAVGCSQAAILLFDDAGIMRFAAWRGLSDAFRRAVEGGPAWTRDVKDPQPVCIEDIKAADLPEFLKDTVRTEQIGSLAFIPLIANGALIGNVMAYYDARHVFSAADVALAVTIARQLAFSLERRRVEEALRDSQRQLVSELAATQELHKISTHLILASDVEVLYEKILHAAVAIMRSDFASMQMFDPERGELRLLAYRGFSPTAAAAWEWVRQGSGTTCSAALAAGHRSIVPDIELSDFIAGSKDLETLRQTGIRAMQSTPLFSRAGGLLGMISTHWRRPHEPTERDLRLLDVLARQAADLIERKQAELTDQRLAAIVDSSHDAIFSEDSDGLITTWNRGAERLFGYAPADIIGRPVTTLMPGDRHHEGGQILERTRRGERVDAFETVRKHRDGSPVDVSVSVSPVRNAAGEVNGASRIVRDIAARKKRQSWHSPSAPCSLRSRQRRPVSAALRTISIRRGCKFARVTRRFTASPMRPRRSRAANGSSACTLTTARDGKRSGAAPTASGGRNIVGNIELFGLEERFAGSRHVFSFRTTAMAALNAQWAWTLMSLGANAPRSNSAY
jgi:PAS domain S-box-containing protein